jgi:hypothetical protein
MPKKIALLVDCDGTIFNIDNIEKDFNMKRLKAPPNDWVVGFVKDLAENGLHILIITARPEKVRSQTEAALKDLGIPYEGLYMRAKGDHRPDVDVKADVLKQIKKDGYKPVMAFEDDPDVISLYGNKEIPVVQVPSPKNYDFD